MYPTLWGPPLWQAMFACAWSCPPSLDEELRVLLTQVLPLLLPCAKCREHYGRHIPVVTRKAKGPPLGAEQSVRWLWHLKNEVNRTLSPPRPSITMSQLTDRLLLHGGLVDDVALGDVLVLVAIEAHETTKCDDDFLRLCSLLSLLLPLPSDSQLRMRLSSLTRRPIVAGALRAARAARVERGLRPLLLAHYNAMTQ